MALFQRNKKEVKVKQKEEKAVEKPAVPVTVLTSGGSDLSDILRNPRITEKATAHGELGVYTFDVSERATKRAVAAAILTLYKVAPRKVRIVPVPSKVRRSVRTGARGISRGGKKAYVYLKKGDSITIS